MNRPRILIAGIGNIFLGDDAFGVEVAQRLLRRQNRPDVRVVDFGIRGLDLVYALLDGCETVIIVDAVPRGDGPPGTLYVLEPPLDQLGDTSPLIEAHSMDPVKVLRTAVALGATPRQVLIVGCEPTPIAESLDGAMPVSISVEVSAAVNEAIALIDSLVERIAGPIQPGETDAGKELKTWLH
ncbi:MAG TPA: hydrogenase maturation protease [Tepidisphaeraceae bacterium]|nr:hydrogenase maturation protease [Tepidisphaeraceae bacterium]